MHGFVQVFFVTWAGTLANASASTLWLVLLAMLHRMHLRNPMQSLKYYVSW